MQTPTIRWGYAMAGALGAIVVLVGAAYLWVAIYSHVLVPGKTFDEYQAYARTASPILGFLAGVPIFFWLGRRAGTQATAIALWGIFALFAGTIPLAEPDKIKTALVCAVDLPLKLAGVWLGWRTAQRPEQAAY